ncbi:MAG: glycosyltransferase family 4 protein [Herpetosiphon sp.]
MEQAAATTGDGSISNIPRLNNEHSDDEQMGRPLRIAIVGMGGVTDTFPNWPERVLGKALVARGHHVVSVGYYQPEQAALRERHARIDGITVRRVPVRHWPNNKLRQALDELGPFDVIHLMHPRNVLAYGTMRWAEQKQVPVVYTWLGPFHDRYLVRDRERPYDEEPNYQRLNWNVGTVLERSLRDGRLRDHVRNYALHYPLKAAQALMPCSEHEAEILRRMGLRQEQTVVPLWIDTERIRRMPERPPVLTHPALLFIGQLTPRKGYDLIIKALPTVLKQFPTTTLHLVSGLNQSDREAMEQMAQEAGVAEQLVFHGRIEDIELVNLLRAVDVYVTPTRYEGFGLTLLEAMAADCPIVASAIPVVNEIIEHGVSGWLVAADHAEALAEGIMRVIGNTGIQDELRAGGQAALDMYFSPQRLIQQVEEVYYSVCAGSPEPVAPRGKRVSQAEEPQMRRSDRGRRLWQTRRRKP